MATSSHPGDSVLSHSSLERGPECSRLLTASSTPPLPYPDRLRGSQKAEWRHWWARDGQELQVALSLWPCLGNVPNDESERIQLCTVTVVVLLFPSVEYHHPKVGFQHQYSHPPHLT